MKDSKIKKIDAHTQNAGLHFDYAPLNDQEQDPQYELEAATLNGPIVVRLPNRNVKCKLRASTANGGIHVDVNDLDYRVREKNYVEAVSREYDAAQAKINMNLKTMNGGINITD